MKKNPAYMRVLLLSIWLLCGLVVTSLQSAQYWAEPAIAAVQQQAQEDETQQEAPVQDGKALLDIADEVLLPLVQHLPTPVIALLPMPAATPAIEIPQVNYLLPAQTKYFRILFRQIISPNAP